MAIAPYDSIFEIITAANVRLNGKVETLEPIGGQVVGNTNSFSQQLVNNAWRKMQNKLADFRYEGLQADVVIPNLPPVASNDPRVQVRLGYDGYDPGNGSVNTSFVLPQSLLRPYELTERPSGTTQLFTDMDPLLWSIPRVPKAAWNRQWLWRADSLYMPGALTTTDLAILYAGLIPDFVDFGGTPWFQQLVTIMRCLDSFADYICREICVARGQMDAAASFQLSAEANARLIINRDTTGGKSIGKNAEYGRMSDQYTPSNLSDTEPVKR